MARELVVRILGDDASLHRAFTRSSRAAGDFDRNLSRSARGAIAASVSFRGLGRAIAFSSNAFLGGAGIVFAIKSTISAAEDSQRVLAQTANAVEAAGISWSNYGKQVQAAALAESNLSGFDDERLLATFASLARATGDVTKSLQLNALAADVARGRNISLESATQLVIKANAGMAGAVRRVLPFLDKNASATQLIGALQQKYAGAAVTYGRTAAGAQDRFRVAVQNLQEAIGSGLLPEITKLLNPLSDWLNNSENQARVQKDIEQVARGLADVFRTFRDVVKTVDKVTGSFKNTLELIVGLKVASVISGWVGPLAKFAAAERAVNEAAVVSRINSYVGGVEAVGGAAVVANGRLATLRTTLLGMSAARFVIPVAIAITAEQVGNALGENTDFSPGRLFGDAKDLLKGKVSKGPLLNFLLGKGFKSDLEKAANATSSTFKTDPSIQNVGAITFKNLRKALLDALDKAAAADTGAGGGRGGLTARQRNTFFDNQIARILLRGGLGNINQQIAALQKADTLIQARLKVTKDVTRRLNLEDQLLQNQAQIRDLQGQQTADRLQKQSDARQKALDALQKQREARAKAIATLTAKQFRQLGLSATGDEITPGVAGLKKRLAQLTENVNASSLNTPKLQTELARFRKVLGEGLVPKDVRGRIKDMMDQIADQLKDAPKQLTKFRHANADVLLSGLGLDADTLRVLRQRLAQVGAGGTIPGGHSAAFAGAGAGTTVIPLTVNLDGKKIAANTTVHQRRQGNRRSDSRRGPYAGRN